MCLKPFRPIHSAWISEHGTLSTSAVPYTIDWDPTRKRGAVPTRQAPSNNTPLVPKGSTNPGNYESEYNSRDYLRNVLEIDLMNKQHEVEDADEFLRRVFPPHCIPLGLDALIEKIASVEEDDNKENAPIETSGEESEGKPKKAKKKKPKKAKKNKKKKKKTGATETTGNPPQESPFSKWDPPMPGPEDVFSSGASSEQRACEFIWRVCDSVEKHLPDSGWEFIRQWTARFGKFCVKSQNLNTVRKPDFSVVDGDVDVDEDEVDWSKIRSFGEYKFMFGELTKQYEKKVFEQMHDYAYCAFEAQEDRRYIPALLWIGHIVRFLVYDRGGLIYTPAINIHERPRTFLHILLGMTYASDVHIGYDPNIFRKADNKRYIKVQGEDYKIKAVLYKSLMITGRATTVFYVTKDGEDYVIKDYWVLVSRGATEVHMLEIFQGKGVEGLPELHTWEDVKINGRNDTCDNNRGAYNDILDRFHRRIVIKGRAVPITSFRSKKELLSAMIDIINCHRVLVERFKILHKDISIYNLMFIQSKDPQRKGLLIDYDYAGDLDEARREVIKQKAMLYLAKTRLTDGLPPPAAPDMPVESGKFSSKGKEKAVEHVETNIAEYSRRAEDGKIMRRNIIKHEQLLARRGQRTGTHPFIAAALLLNPSLTHEAKHDLESLFYVLLYLCTRYVRPGRVKSKGPIPYFIYEWMHPEQHSNESCGHTKRSQKTEADEMYKQDVLSHLTPYMQDLVPLFLDLKNALADDTEESMSHANFERIFLKMRDALPDKEVIPRGKRPLGNNNHRDTLSRKIGKGDRRKALLSADAMYTLDKVCDQPDQKAALEIMKAQVDDLSLSDDGIADDDEIEAVWEEGELEDIETEDLGLEEDNGPISDSDNVDDQFSSEESDWVDFGGVINEGSGSGSRTGFTDRTSSTWSIMTPSMNSTSSSRGEEAVDVLSTQIEDLHLYNVMDASRNSVAYENIPDLLSHPAANTEANVTTAESSRKKRSRKPIDPVPTFPTFDFTLTRAKAKQLGLTQPRSSSTNE